MVSLSISESYILDLALLFAILGFLVTLLLTLFFVGLMGYTWWTV